MFSKQGSDNVEKSKEADILDNIIKCFQNHEIETDEKTVVVKINELLNNIENISNYTNIQFHTEQKLILVERDDYATLEKHDVKKISDLDDEIKDINGQLRAAELQQNKLVSFLLYKYVFNFKHYNKLNELRTRS